MKRGDAYLYQRVKFIQPDIAHEGVWSVIGVTIDGSLRLSRGNSYAMAKPHHVEPEKP